jgi:hypothetical protein
MSEPAPVNKPVSGPLNAEVEGFDAPAELALDLRWMMPFHAGVKIPLEESRIPWQP